MLLGGLSSAAAGMHRYSRDFDRAAENVARAGLANVPSETLDTDIDLQAPTAADHASGSGDDVPESLVRMMIAQRMFTAAARTAQVADGMLSDAIQLADTPSR